jgi:hypothetical protein
MMGGVPRPTIATIVVGFGSWTLWRRWKSGWQLDASLVSQMQYQEGNN